MFDVEFGIPTQVITGKIDIPMSAGVLLAFRNNEILCYIGQPKFSTKGKYAPFIKLTTIVGPA